MNKSSVQDQFEYLRKGAAEIIREDELRAKLEQSLKTGKPLRVKLGVDPTAPDIHLGHTVVLRKLKHFQDMGHTAIFLIGDFTAMIGDPSGRSETRPPLTRAEVEANTRTYLDQVHEILDANRTEVRYNSEWLGKLTSREMITLCSHYQLARMLEREDFRVRLEAGKRHRGLYEPPRSPFAGSRDLPLSPSAGEATGLNQFLGMGNPIEEQPLDSEPGVSSLSNRTRDESFRFPTQRSAPQFKRPESIAIHELLYPLLVAYDSVVLHADVELGATEQKFNLLIGREIQREYGQPAQVAFTMPILTGLDGQRKMSKSLGNYVGITEEPFQMFGKLMSISDEQMWSYYELLTDLSAAEIARLRNDVSGGSSHPMDVKMALARRIVAEFHGPAAAEQAAGEFQRVFRDRRAPEEAPRVSLPCGPPKRLSVLLVELELAASRSEADRLIKQGGVELGDTRVDDVKCELDLSRPHEFLLRAGKKKFLRIVVG